MKRLLFIALFAFGTANAQPVGPMDYRALGQPNGPAQLDSSSTLSANSATATGSPTALSLAAIAAKQGVLLDSFKVNGDADDTASMTRAVAAGVPILLGPKTYTINNYVMAGTPATFVLKGVPGASMIQRTNGSVGSTFFQITATNVAIDGVTFDSNKASVTANQWGVLLATGGQNVTVTHSVFKNNSGTLGSCFALVSTGPAAGGSFNFTDNEVTGCAFVPVLLGSVSNGIVSRNYLHNNTGSGIGVQAFSTPSSTNYASNIVISNNVSNANTRGISVGGIGPPYVYGTPQAKYVKVIGNQLQDNSLYGIVLQGDYLDAIGNQMSQSSSAVAVFGGIDCNSRFGIVSGNNVAFSGGVLWGIDCGASVGMRMEGNTISMDAGTALNVGGSINDVARNNTLYLTGTAKGIYALDVEADGNGVAFPQHASGTAIEDNWLYIQASTATGITVVDNAGGTSGAVKIFIRRNHFAVTGIGTGPGQDISYVGTGVDIQGNDHNGAIAGFVDINGNGDVIYSEVFDEVIGLSSTANIRAILTTYMSTFGGGGSILYVTTTAGGSGYIPATTTVAANGSGGGSGWTGTAMISAGVIVGVRTLTNGSGYSGTLTVTATDSGGGSGATFTVANLPVMPANRKLIYNAGTGNNLLVGTGGSFAITGWTPTWLTHNRPIALEALSTGAFWSAGPYLPSIYAIGSMPTCNATANGSLINVTGSVSGKWQARCNATNWIAPDGTTIN